MRRIFAGLAAGLLASATAAAQPTITPEMMIGFLDGDGDGVVSKTEFINAQTARFGQFDINANGYMAYREFFASLDKASQRNAEASFKAFDVDRDNRLSRTEFLTYHAWVFDNVLDRPPDPTRSSRRTTTKHTKHTKARFASEEPDQTGAATRRDPSCAWRASWFDMRVDSRHGVSSGSRLPAG